MTSRISSVQPVATTPPPVTERQVQPMVEVSDLTFAYAGQSPVFEHFGFRALPGEAWAIIGPSGCGKSTLLYLIAGLRQGQGGTVLVAGHPVPRPRASTGLVLQDYGLLPWATIWENVDLVRRIGRFYEGKEPGSPVRPYPRADIPSGQVHYWLDRLGIAGLRDKYPAQISGGQRQRAAIARSLMQQPNLLLLDEPFSSLDAVTREDLQQLTVELSQETGVTTIVVTHTIEEAAFIGRDILVLDRPPNLAPRVVANPGAGGAGYRTRPEFWQKVAELRTLLEGAG